MTVLSGLESSAGRMSPKLSGSRPYISRPNGKVFASEASVVHPFKGHAAIVPHCKDRPLAQARGISVDPLSREADPSQLGSGVRISSFVELLS